MTPSSMLRGLALALATLVLAACAHVAELPTRDRPLTVLISIDGFRPDYLDRGITPNLSRLAGQGARGAMRPSFPSKTFPNHYTMVTGLRPDRHGIIENTIQDPQIPGVTFRLADKTTAQDPRWWDDATPIWVTAEQAGMRTGPMFWPGSEVAIHGTRPSYWKPFDQAMPADARVDQVLDWLDLPPAERPAFVTVYFDEVDTLGHQQGPDSTLLDAAVVRTDAAVGRLVEGLTARRLAANILVVADHGMAPISVDRVIYLDDLLPLDAGKTLTLGAYMSLVPARGREAEVEAALLKSHPHLQCWRKGEIPARFHYGANPRVPPIFCLPDTGWEITTKAWVAQRGVKGGDHGFDPYAPEMRAVFVAAGPAFRTGVRVADFENVDIYPLLARLLGLQPLPNYGDLRDLKPILAP